MDGEMTTIDKDCPRKGERHCNLMDIELLKNASLKRRS